MHSNSAKMLCDAHTHLSEYSPEELGPVLQRASDAGVGLIVAAGTTIQSSQACVALAEAHREVLAGVGVHPTELRGALDATTMDALRALARCTPKAVCISEVGLDFLPTSPPWELQLDAFRLQLRLALELGLPVIFHSRDSHSEVLRVLREERAGRVGGAMHYFQSDLRTAHEAMDAGFHVSLAKPLLRLPELQEVAKALPLERIVLETDAAPQPWKKHRRNWTEPAHVRLVAEKLAELKGVPTAEVAAITTSNLRRLLKLPAPAQQ